jgi:PAS domain S-box-containing protein
MGASSRISDSAATPRQAAQELVAILQRMGSVGRPEAANDRATALAPPQAAADETRTPEPSPTAAVVSPASPPKWDEDALRAVLESVPDAVIAADIRGTILLVNRQTEDLFGYSRAELLGRPVETLMPERYRAAHVKQRDSYFADPRIRPMGANLDLWGRRRDGREFPVEISLSPLRTPTGLLVTTTVRDISLRRQAEDQLRHAEARYRTLVEEIPAVTFMAALDDTAAAINELYVSPQIESLLGFTQKEWLEDPVLWYRQLHPEDRDRWHVEFARTCSTAEPFDAVYRFVARDGRVVWVHGHAKVVRDKNGRPLFLQGVAFDITERKRAEEALSQLNLTLERRVTEALAEADARAQELSRSNEALDRFAYIASHDLREPLRTMMRYMQLLERQHGEALEPTAREYVAKTITGARQMNQLISDLHTHSRIGRQGGFTPIDVGAVVTEACGNLRAALEESQAVVTTEALPTIRGVRSEIVLLFQNLIENAVKFRGDAPPAVQVGARRQDDHWFFWLRDNGIGIEPQYLERIFGIGERLHGRRFPGTGFGLANCRKIVQHHGGQIWAESAPGAGTTFYFQLPDSI